MTFPKCKIEIYDTAGTLTHTITSDIKECHTKDILTSEVGSFNFILNAKKGHNYFYNDLGNNYVAKIYFGYGSNLIHLFTGKILPFTSQNGTTSSKFFEGKSLTEILERRQKTNKRWQATEADDIAATVASDLSLGSDLDVDTTAETITVRTESYFDLLKKVSDYWSSAISKVTKDFCVDKGDAGHPQGHLVWKARPWRTTGVEALVYGKDFKEYNLKYDILGVKNNITVYGAPTSTFPVDKDIYTETDLASWSATSGTLTLDNTYAEPTKEGSYKILCQHSDVSAPYTQHVQCLLTLPRLTLRDINTLNFYHYPGSSNSNTYSPLKVRIHAPDASNYFETNSDLNVTQQWHWNSLPLGDTAMYDADENPTGTWVIGAGAPNWWAIQGVEFNAESTGASGTLLLGIDKLYFSPDRWVSTVNDSTSITAYGQRDAEFTDENLLSTTECTQRAQTWLYQLKDRVLRLDFTIEGNTNVLIGDRLTLDLPPDAITATAFDVVSVENHYLSAPNGYKTTVHCIQGANTRILPPTNPLESIQRSLQHSKEVTAELYSRVVR